MFDSDGFDLPDVVAQTQGVTSDARGTEVQVEVVGPRATPDLTRSLRARARALMSVGPVPSVADSIEDVTAGDMQRLTKEVDKPPIREPRGVGMEATLHTIIVNRE